MGLLGGLKAVREKLAVGIGGVLDRTLGDQPDSAAAPGARQPADQMPLSELDEISAGFPKDLR